ncbi:MAG: alpha/beta hydrolase [Chitinophagales bacterium]|nr:alpha/beta hydrolase [Chitinophagales bacterium]
MHYKVSGKGKAVVLVHGFMEEGSMWNDVVRALSKSHKVIVPDLEGFGNSPLKHSSAKLSMEKYADDVFEMLQKEKVKKCIMLGHSMGGYITLHFAEKHPAMLSAFGLLNSHCFEDTPEKKANRQKTIEFVRKNGTKHFVRELYHVIFHESYQKKNKKLIDSLIAKALKYSPEAVMLATEAMMKRKGKEEVLKSAKVPVLLVNGKEDPAAPFELTLKQASFPAEAHIHLFADSAHMSVFERKKETIRIVKDFCGQ